MRLLCCDIAGFGRLKELHIDFKRGLNACVEENGWGKTTLSVFLKVMLFGMEQSRRKTLSERAHYEPWDGGSYGGSLTFEADGRQYRVERTFGRKETEDTFALYDAGTGMVSEDYGSDLGRELFGVDRDSFTKSIFFPQNALRTGMTDALNARIGNIASAQDDIDHFEEAFNRLEEAKRVYTRNSKQDPGKLLAVRKDIRERREALESLPSVLDALGRQRQMLDEKRGILADKCEEKDALSEAIASQSRQEQEIGVFREKIETKNKLEADLIKQSSIFGSAEPTDEQLSKMEGCERQVEIEGKRLESVLAELPDEAEQKKLIELFEGREISDAMLDEWGDKADFILKLRLKSEHLQLTAEEKEQLAELSAYFSRKDPTEEELEQAITDAAELSRLEGQVEMLHEQYRNTRARAAIFRETPRETGSPRGLFYGSLSAAVLLAGAAAFSLSMGEVLGYVLASACVLAAAAIVGVMVVFSVRQSQIRKKLVNDLDLEIAEVKAAYEEKEQERERKKECCREFLEGFLVSPADSYAKMIGELRGKKEIYSRLQEREKKSLEDASGTLEDLSALVVELYTALAPYAEVYGVDLYETWEENEIVTKLKQDIIKYRSYLELKEEQERLEIHIDELDGAVKTFLAGFVLEGESDKEKLSELRRSWDMYSAKKQQLLEVREDIRSFEESSGIGGETKSITQLQEMQAALDDEIGALNRQILKAQETENELTDQLEYLDEVGEKLELLTHKEKEYAGRVRLYDDTMRYLTKARELFMERYLGPLRERLWYYLSRLNVSGEGIAPAAECFTLDMDLSIQMDYRGSVKASEYFSSGYQDLLAVCARLALVDILYKNEMPFILLDDSFVNLDEPRMEQAKRLLRELARSRQVVYFTCHESRIP